MPTNYGGYDSPNQWKIVEKALRILFTGRLLKLCTVNIVVPN
jgi:hypothetical protein